jgi:biopolymer transport protein ExbD
MSFANPRQPARRGVPLAPLLDVLFLLLIFFALTSSIRATEQMIPLEVPAAQSGETQEGRRTETIVNVRQDGAIVVNGRPHTLAELRTLLVDLVAEFPNERVVIRGHRDADLGRVVAIFDIARLSGVKNVQIATRPQEAAEGG